MKYNQYFEESKYHQCAINEVEIKNKRQYLIIYQESFQQMKIPKEAVPSCVGFSEIAAARLSLRRQLQQFQLLSEGMRGGWLI